MNANGQFDSSTFDTQQQKQTRPQKAAPPLLRRRSSRRSNIVLSATSAGDPLLPSTTTTLKVPGDTGTTARSPRAYKKSSWPSIFFGAGSSPRRSRQKKTAISDERFYPPAADIATTSTARDGGTGTALLSKFMFIFGLALILAPWFYHSSLNWKMSTIIEDILDVQEQQEEYTDDLKRWNIALSEINEKAKPLEVANEQMLRQLQARGDTIDTSTDAYKVAEEIENRYLERIDSVESAIRARSLRDIIAKYGQNLFTDGGGGGQLRINVTLSEETGPQSGRWFVIETAPVKQVPHGVDLFVRMAIEYNMYDDMTLLHQSQQQHTPAGLIHSVPISSLTHGYVDHHYDKVPGFVPQLAMSDTTDEYPNEKYSVVFSGRPGGPNFYVNMNGNSKEITNRKETPIGKITQGKLVLDRIMQSDSSSSRLKMYGIESMKLIEVTE